MIDPTRPFHGASGGTHIATDIWTVHNYEQDPAKLKEKLYNGGKLMEAPKWEIHLMPMNIGYNGLKYTDQYAFPEYKKDMPYLVDEFGGTSGIVTLEDLVEEIFGEIEDEHDMKSHVAKKVSDNEYLLSGRMEIDTLNEMFGLDLPESDDYVTIAGFILHFYQKFPKLNETVQIDKYSFKIIKVTATKIELVRMKVGI